MGIIEDKIVLGDLMFLLMGTPWGQKPNRITLAVAGGENDTGTTLYYDTHRGMLDVSLETKGFTNDFLVPGLLALIVRYQMIVKSNFDFYSPLPMSINEVIEVWYKNLNLYYF